MESKSLSTLTALYNNLKWIYLSLEEPFYRDKFNSTNRTYLNNIYEINNEYDINEDNWNEISTSSERKKSLIAYNYLFNKHINLLGHYFRHLYNILEFVEKYANDKSDERKKEIINKYSQFIQAQLSNSELALLFYNGLKFDNMYQKICDFNLIENLAKEELIKEGHTKFYPVKIKSKNNT